MQELEHLNEEVASLAARQAEIRGKLQDAGATDIPALDSSAESFGSCYLLQNFMPLHPYDFQLVESG